MVKFERKSVSDDQANGLRQQLLQQRLVNLESEHVQATFAVEQIERQITEARGQLDELGTGSERTELRG